MTKVACPQCNTTYIIVYPDMGMLTKLFVGAILVGDYKVQPFEYPKKFLLHFPSKTLHVVLLTSDRLLVLQIQTCLAQCLQVGLLTSLPEEHSLAYTCYIIYFGRYLLPVEHWSTGFFIPTLRNPPYHSEFSVAPLKTKLKQSWPWLPLLWETLSKPLLRPLSRVSRLANPMSRILVRICVFWVNILYCMVLFQVR